jgi:hypothetical protein
MSEKSSWSDTLKQAAEGLLFPSESEFPFTYVEWPDYQGKRLNAGTVLRLLGLPADTPIEKRSLDQLFKPVTEGQDWYGEEENETVRKFVRLKERLTGQLTNIGVYRVGKIEVSVYIAGKTPDGHWAGLSTKVIET